MAAEHQEHEAAQTNYDNPGLKGKVADRKKPEDSRKYKGLPNFEDREQASKQQK